MTELERWNEEYKVSRHLWCLSEPVCPVRASRSDACVPVWHTAPGAWEVGIQWEHRKEVLTQNCDELTIGITFEA